jgi:hypothetical protein
MTCSFESDPPVRAGGAIAQRVAVKSSGHLLTASWQEL